MEKVKVDNIWEIQHRAVATDHMVFSTTMIKAINKDKALKFFNKHIADGKWTYKAELKDVKPFKCYESF